MQRTEDELRDQIVALLHASRELSPAEDTVLAETFVRQTGLAQEMRRPWIRLTASFCALLTAIGILLAIPVVMVIHTLSVYDGYLPRLDTGALPALYYVALVIAVISLLASVVSQRTGWRVQVRVTPVRELKG